MFYKILLVIIVVLSLNACTMLETEQQKSINNVSIIASSQVKKTSFQIPQSWSAKGRLALLGGEENWHAAFSWSQENQSYQLRFSDPLGQTQLAIEHIAASEKTPRLNRLYIDGKQYESQQSMRQLLAEHSAIYVPIDALKYWFFAKADQSLDYKLEYFEDGNIKTLYQQGWIINFSRYQNAQTQQKEASISYPRKITASKEPYKIKLIVKSLNVK